MTLDILSLLPLLEGWDYHPYDIPATTVAKNDEKFLTRIEVPGWLLSVGIVTNDAYATLRIRYKGAGNLWFVQNWNAEGGYVLGATQQDPAGWVQLYNRPFPPSTFGAYFIVGVSSGFQGTLFPYVPDIVVEGYLGVDSTQTSAILAASALAIEIIDRKAFVKSLRELGVLGGIGGLKK